MAFVEALNNFGAAAVNSVHAACNYASEGALGVLRTSDKVFIATALTYVVGEGVNMSGQLKVNSWEITKFATLVGVVYSFIRGIAAKADEKNEVKNRNLIEYATATTVALVTSHKLGFNVTAPQGIIASAVAYKIAEKVQPHLVEFFKAKV